MLAVSQSLPLLARLRLTKATPVPTPKQTLTHAAALTAALAVLKAALLKAATLAAVLLKAATPAAALLKAAAPLRANRPNSYA